MRNKDFIEPETARKTGIAVVGFGQSGEVVPSLNSNEWILTDDDAHLTKRVGCPAEINDDVGGVFITDIN